jgi:predicted transcriptional regulator
MAQPEPSIFDEPDDEAEARALEEAEEAIRAGQVVSHEAMKAWLMSWGTPDELPPPPAGA